MRKLNIIFAIKSVKPSGGALKVRHYYEHALSHKNFNTLLYMPDDIDWHQSNPWYKYRDNVLPEIDWNVVDIVFISGWGWERFIPSKYHYESTFKVIYLVQHPSKLMPEFDRYKNLDKPATRICVSGAMTEMANKIPNINGPVLTIPAGTDLTELQSLAEKPKTTDVLIAGLKNPAMGEALYAKLGSLGLTVKLLTERMDRRSFIDFISVAKIVVCLPNPLEGFYLPALEAMALNALVICPYAIGNDYCIDGKNGFVPAYTLEDIYNVVRKSLELTDEEMNVIKRHAGDTVKAHDIKLEKKSFHELLNKYF